MAGWTRCERERIEQLVAEGAPAWMLFRAVPHSRHAVRRYVLRLKRVPEPPPVRSPLRLSLAEREEISRGLARDQQQPSGRTCAPWRATTNRRGTSSLLRNRLRFGIRG